VDPKKRLPVLKLTPEEEQGEEPRPPWQWVGFGVGATFGAWLPLAYGASALGNKIVAGILGDLKTPEEVSAAVAALSGADRARLYGAMIGLPALALVIASIFGGWIVGRWGGDKAGPREAAMAGVATGLIAVVLSFSAAGVSLYSLVVIPITALASWVGGRLGMKRRIKMLTPNMR
jgi:hypothetical protein